MRQTFSSIDTWTIYQEIDGGRVRLNTQEAWRGQGGGMWKRVNELYHPEVRPVVRIGGQYLLDPHQADDVSLMVCKEPDGGGRRRILGRRLRVEETISHPL